MSRRNWWTIYDDVVDFEQELIDEELANGSFEKALEMMKKRIEKTDHFKQESDLFEV